MMIQLEKVNQYYPAKAGRIHALVDINLSIQSGEIFGILGKSGAGKSTLLHTLNLLEKPTSGRIRINDADITQFTKAELRRFRHTVGMIFQHFNLLTSRTAFENIALPLALMGASKKEIKTKVDSLLALVDLQDRQHHYPQELSGGQKQRVAIARALATDPDILLCDEATASLDPDATKNVLKLLSTINQKFNLTIVLITHELDVIKHICDRAAVLDQGKLVEVADTLALFSNPQHATTKSFVNESIHFEPSPQRQALKYASAEQTSRLIKLTFMGQDSTVPLISKIVRQYNVTVNILQADITYIKHKPIGYTICELSGTPQELASVIVYIETLSIQWEELYYA